MRIHIEKLSSGFNNSAPKVTKNNMTNSNRSVEKIYRIVNPVELGTESVLTQMRANAK